MPLVLFLLPLGIAAAIGWHLAEEREEEALLWRLLGYGVLGFVTLNLNRLSIPLGFVVALFMANRVTVNRSARLGAATVAFVVWLLYFVMGR